jgi:hypothetical protein
MFSEAAVIRISKAGCGGIHVKLLMGCTTELFTRTSLPKYHYRHGIQIDVIVPDQCPILFYKFDDFYVHI